MCCLVRTSSWGVPSPCVSAGSASPIRAGNCGPPHSAGAFPEVELAFKPSPRRSAVNALTDLLTGSIPNHPELDLLLLPVAEPHPPSPVDVPSTTWGCSTPGDSTGNFDCRDSQSHHSPCISRATRSKLTERSTPLS